MFYKNMNKFYNFVTRLHFKKILISCFALSSLAFTSCLPQISVKAGNSDEATVFFSTGFSPSFAKTLKNLSGLDQSSAIFNKDDILQLLNSAGAVDTSASLPAENEIAATGRIPALSENVLAKAGIIKRTENSLTLTIGSKQIVNFYDFLNDEAKSYLDLMMIPALIGEKMNVEEYSELLSSMYGPAFADEIIKGKLTIGISSPNGKKQIKESVSLGELLTQTEERNWTVKW